MVFMTMGFSDAVGPYVSLAKEEFQLSTEVASMIPLAGLSMYGLLSIPAGILQHRLGKKFALTLGLLVTLAGILNASFGLTTVPRFLLTVFLVGAGAAILQVAATPIMRDVSLPGKSPRNLVRGQFMKAIGSLSGPILPFLPVQEKYTNFKTECTQEYTRQNTAALGCIWTHKDAKPSIC